MSLTYAFFFFQAEDGIRDTSVTGVQTCALPISHRSDQLLLQRYGQKCFVLVGVGKLRLQTRTDRLQLRIGRVERDARAQRSEERRVGKECRSRWSAYQ